MDMESWKKTARQRQQDLINLEKRLHALADDLNKAEAERNRYKSALKLIVAQQRWRPLIKDYGQDEIGARGYAVAQARWYLAQMAQNALTGEDEDDR